MTTNDDKKPLRDASMFLVGFIMVLPLRLALSCAKYALGRFRLPVSKLGVFIKLFHNPIELGGLAGFAVSNTIASVVKEKKLKAILSVITNWLMFVLSLITFYVYTSGGNTGNPNLYLWTIVVHYFLVGLNVTFSNGVESDAVTFFNAGVPLSAVFVAIYHKVFLYFADKFLPQDVDYWIIFGQCVANMIFMFTTACAWTMNCYFNHFTASQSDGGSASPQKANGGCCCCCKDCNKECESECKCDEGDDGNCKLCKIAKILCCLCKNGETCTKCVTKFSECVGKLTSGDCSSVDAETLTCTCKGCNKENTCCRVKRFEQFCKKSCEIINTATCYCKTIIRLAVAFKTRSSNTSICVGATFKAIIELCACCGECENDCLKSGKCSIVNILKCLFANEKCLCQNQVRTNGCNSLCKCVLDLFKRIKCTLNISPCVNCRPCIASGKCTRGQCCLLCWKRLFKCYIICGGKCKVEEGKSKCCCVGGESPEEQCTCCTPQEPVATECTCNEGEKCCSCCISCGETCKKPCDCKSGGECNNCCCCCKKNCQSLKTQSSSTCIFAWIYYWVISIKDTCTRIIFGYYEAFYCYYTGTTPHSSCKCCCCKDETCACPSHQNGVQEQEECKCCCCNGGTEEQSGKEDNAKPSLIEGLKEPWTWSPFMLTVFSLGAFYCVYPGIAPFLLVDPSTAYNIEIINLIVHPMPALIICILDQQEIGPGNKWDTKWWWNLSWAIEAYALFCVYTCYTILHYPDSFLGKLIIGNSALVGFMTVSFVTTQEGLKAVGLSAVGKQKNGKDIDNLSTITLAISLAILNFTNFLGDGYLQTYRKADKENWPTKGYTRYRGFKFWINAAFKLATKNLLNAFNVDVRGRTLM